ncbi:unnamed protein product, partial [marine sediment metagenome]
MPPNPYIDVKMPIVQPEFPILMNVGRQRVDKPEG